MATLIHDLRYALRKLMGNHGFVAIAILSLALGIGATTAIFAVIRGVLLRPLPYVSSDQLVAVWETNPSADIYREPSSTNNFLDWSQQSQTLSAMAATSAPVAQTLSAENDAWHVVVSGITEGYLDLLGVQPPLGRGFLASEYSIGNHQVAVLGHALWQRRFAADSTVIGSEIELNGRPHTVIGVMPPTYRHPNWQDRDLKPELLIPLPLEAYEDERRYDWLTVIGRLAPDMTLARASAEMDGIGARLAIEYPEANGPYRVEVTSLHKALFGDLERPLWLVFAAIASLLLLVASNLSILVLARVSDQRRELAVRTALGASRQRLAGQLITEYLILSLFGGGLGLGVAWLTSRLLATYSHLLGLAGEQVELGVWSLVFAGTASAVVGLGFGLIALTAAPRAYAGGLLRSATARVGLDRGWHGLRAVLVASQVAIALVILVCAGLLVRSYQQVQTQELGFRPDRLLTAQVKLPIRTSSKDPKTGNFLAELLLRVRGLPGVEEAGAVSTFPLGGDRFKTDLGFEIEGRSTDSEEEAQQVVVSAVTPGYFKALGIPLRAGRLLEEFELLPMAVINKTLAQHYSPGQDPLGMRVRLGNDPVGQYRMIVGVVGDARQSDRTAPPDPQIYITHRQLALSTMTLVVRSATSNPETLVPGVRSQLKSMDNQRYLFDVRTGHQLLSDVDTERRISVGLGVVTSILTLLLATVGLYGMIAYTVAQRVPEISLRIALGAKRADVLALVLRQGLTTTGLGLVGGTMAALLTTRLLAGLLFGISATDPTAFLGAAALFIAVTLAASFLPAYRAMRVDPGQALRGS